MKPIEIIDKVYEIVYNTYESRLATGVRMQHNAGNAQFNEIQFRTMRNIAELKKDPNNEQLAHLILVDCDFALAQNWMTKESHDTVAQLLGQLGN